MADSYPYPDYHREPLELTKTDMWEVYDPWSAAIRGVFYTEADAKVFRKALMRQWKKGQK